MLHNLGGLPITGKCLTNSGPILVKYLLNSLLIICESFVKTPLILYSVLLFRPELFVPIISLIMFPDFF